MSEPKPLPNSGALDDAALRDRLARMTRRSFAVGGVAALAGAGAWRWLATCEEEDGIPWPLRRVLQGNARLAEDYFHPTRLAPTFAHDEARMPRANGAYGLSAGFDPAEWQLQIEHRLAGGPSLGLSLDDIKALPAVEQVTELKCIEGWSDVVHWTGARLSDLLAKYSLGTRSGKPPDAAGDNSDLFKYVGLETPDRGYYVGLDMASALHPQTLLCYAMNGEPLALAHGAPLRLVITVKYGIKHLKRIGTIRFTDTPPADYWGERGYDWHSGH